MSYKRNIRLPAPYLKRVWLDPSRIADRAAYPFCLPFLQDDFELSFDRPITIIVGENGTGKSTFLEGVAVLAGYDEAGGGKGYMPVDHSKALEKMGGQLSSALRASWLPKSPTDGSFAPRAFSRLRDTRTRSISKIFPAFPPVPRLTSSRIPTARVFCDSSKNAAGSRAFLSSTNRNRRCRRRARSNF